VIYFVMMNGRGHARIGRSTWYYFTQFSTIRGIDELNSIAVASFGRYRSIRFGTMMNDYREVVAVLKDRGRVLPWLVCSRIVFKWVKPRFSANFYRHRRELN
jgi:hypothetical protein